MPSSTTDFAEVKDILNMELKQEALLLVFG